ncbi:MAG: hypothetical protein R2774_07770 [Saprospiraceae bacterium]
MRRKLVLWGANEKDEKILVALELLEKQNEVDIYTFDEASATEAFFKDMSDNWVNDKDVEFPQHFQKIVRKLSVTDSILPDHIKVDKSDQINRAQTEWHFVVLSSKLYEMYKSELEEIKEKVTSLTSFDNATWTDLKNFWSKVQNQVNDKNLFREQGAALRDKTNHLFDIMKEFKKSLDSEFEQQSKSFLETIKGELTEIENKIENGFGLSPLFEDLKKIQNNAKDIKFTRDDRNEIWKSIDEAFKKLKEKRGNQGGGGNNQVARLEARYNGLIAAMQKMKRSIDMDKKDLDYQNKKVEDSDGQLESLLRQAKINMIDERYKSKLEKYQDMEKTKAEIESKLEKERKRASKAEKVEVAKDLVKQKIASDISEQAKQLEPMSESLAKAATEIVESKKKKGSGMLANLAESAANFMEDVVDSAKAVAEVVGDKLEDISDKAEDVFEDVKDKADDAFENLADNADSKFNQIKEDVVNAYEKAESVVENISDKVEDKLEDAIDAAKEKFADTSEDVAEVVNDATSEVDKKSDDDTLELKQPEV